MDTCAWCQTEVRFLTVRSNGNSFDLICEFCDYAADVFDEAS